MLAMHYAISLAGPDGVAAVRKRAAERGPSFDGTPGLACKLFLVDPVDPCYATFYLWQAADAALAFLDGPGFRALTEAFGRPEVRLLLTAATELPFPAGSAIALGPDDGAATAGTLRALDPRTGERFALGPACGSRRRFEVMYRAVGAAAGAALSPATPTRSAAGS
jgi:hypothetical protein